jgi:hypothetical protein
MAAADASVRGQRDTVLASPLRDLTGFVLIIDCCGPCCGGERSYALTALAAHYRPDMTVDEALLQMRCARGCGGRPQAAWLATGPTMRLRPRRVPLLGPEARA